MTVCGSPLARGDYDGHFLAFLPLEWGTSPGLPETNSDSSLAPARNVTKRLPTTTKRLRTVTNQLPTGTKRLSTTTKRLSTTSNACHPERSEGPAVPVQHCSFFASLRMTVNDGRLLTAHPLLRRLRRPAHPDSKNPKRAPGWPQAKRSELAPRRSVK